MTQKAALYLLFLASFSPSLAVYAGPGSDGSSSNGQASSIRSGENYLLSYAPLGKEITVVYKAEEPLLIRFYVNGEKVFTETYSYPFFGSKASTEKAIARRALDLGYECRSLWESNVYVIKSADGKTLRFTSDVETSPQEPVRRGPGAGGFSSDY